MSAARIQPVVSFQAMPVRELALKAQSGSEDAFAELAQRFRPRLYTVLERRLVGSQVEAEDVIQETLTRAWQKRSQFDSKYQFSTWIFTIALRLATDHCRRERRRRNDVQLASDPVDNRKAASHTAQIRDESQNIWAVGRRVLSEIQYTALWLRYGEDLDVADVAHAMGKTRVSTRVLIHRTRKILQRHLNEKNECAEGTA